MAILVLGTITNDTKIFLDLTKIEGLGGILYNIISLSSLTDETIIPIANVGEDIYDEVIDILKPYSNIQTEGLRRVPPPNNHCYLFFVLEYPGEVLVGRVPSISYNQVKEYLPDASAIVLNFTSGFDLKLNTLKKISNTAECPIFLGYQLLGLGIDSLGNRFLRKKRNWLEWVMTADVIQFDRFEAELIYRKPICGLDDIIKFANPILCGRPNIVTVTLGEEGSFVAFSENGRICAQHIPAYHVDKVVDASGCGDVYFSSFAVNYLKTLDIIKSSIIASYVAGKKCTIPGVGNLYQVISEDKYW